MLEFWVKSKFFVHTNPGIGWDIGYNGKMKTIQKIF